MAQGLFFQCLSLLRRTRRLSSSSCPKIEENLLSLFHLLFLISRIGSHRRRYTFQVHTVRMLPSQAERATEGSCPNLSCVDFFRTQGLLKKIEKIIFTKTSGTRVSMPGFLFSHFVCGHRFSEVPDFSLPGTRSIETIGTVFETFFSFLPFPYSGDKIRKTFSRVAFFHFIPKVKTYLFPSFFERTAGLIDRRCESPHSALCFRIIGV